MLLWDSQLRRRVVLRQFWELGDGSEPESDYISTSDETQQQPNVVVQGKEVKEANEATACNQKRKLLLPLFQHPLKTKILPHTGCAKRTREH